MHNKKALFESADLYLYCHYYRIFKKNLILIVRTDE
jgi:hypothetical protein